jgi:transposase
MNLLTFRRKRAHQRLRRLDSDIYERDLRFLLRKLSRDGLANARTAAGDENDFAF